MKNLTLAVDDELLESVRVIAAEKKTTVNAMVRDFFEEISGREAKHAQARRRLLELIDASDGDMGPDFKWSREDLYER